MEALEHFVARDLFTAAKSFASRFKSAGLPSQGSDSKLEPEFDDVFEFHVTFLELLGKTARDIVGTGNNPESTPLKSVDIIEDKAIIALLPWYLS